MTWLKKKATIIILNTTSSRFSKIYTAPSKILNFFMEDVRETFSRLFFYRNVENVFLNKMMLLKLWKSCLKATFFCLTKIRLKEKPYVFPWNRKIIYSFAQKCFACQNAQFCFLTQMIKMSNRSYILAQKRSPEKCWKIKMQ